MHYNENTNQRETTNKLASMKHIMYSSVLSILMLTSGTSAFSASAADGDLAAEAQKAIQVLQTRDSTLTNLFTSAAGFAVFPSVGKGGLFFGGEHGKGIVYEESKPIGKATLTEINAGPQVGGQSFYEVIIFRTAEALANFKEGHFEMSAEVSAVAAAEGAGLNAKYRKGVMVFTLPRTGLMVQATLGGQKFKYKPLD
jgi:lipid-binding SYLF domain-containing protein